MYEHILLMIAVLSLHLGAIFLHIYAHNVIIICIRDLKFWSYIYTSVGVYLYNTLATQWNIYKQCGRYVCSDAYAKMKCMYIWQ